MDFLIRVIDKKKQASEYDWVDLIKDNDLIGKARCKIGPNKLIIYSINIYPEWKNNGFGKRFIEYCKGKYSTIVADRVKKGAVGFWEHLGFKDANDGNWIFNKE